MSSCSGYEEGSQQHGHDWSTPLHWKARKGEGKEKREATS